MITLKSIIENKEQLFEEIKSEDFLWLGEKNGDNITKYQGRKLRQLAIVILLVSAEMEIEDTILNRNQRQELFFDFVRNLGGRQPSEGSGKSYLSLEIIGNLWKQIN